MRFHPCTLPLALGALLAQQPADLQGLLDRGVQAFKEARYADAATDFQRAVDLNPSSTQAHLYLANAEMNQFIPGAVAPESAAHAQRAEAEYRRVLETVHANAA